MNVEYSVRTRFFNQMSIYKSKLQLAFVTLGRRLFNIAKCELILSHRLLLASLCLFDVARPFAFEISFNVNFEEFMTSPLLQSSTKEPKL